MSWASLGAVEIPGLSTILAGLESISQLASGAAAAAQTALQLASLARLTPQQMALQAAVSAAKKLIEDFVSAGSGGYALMVPARKRTFFSATLAAAMARAHLTTIPQIDSDPRIAQLWSEAGAQGASKTLLDASRAADGGNLGYLRTVAESLADVSDLCRPTMPASWHVWGVCVVAGTEDPLAYVSLARWLAAVTGGSSSNPYATSAGLSVLPRPTGLRAKAITAPDAEGKVSVALTWDGAAVTSSPEQLKGESVTIKRVAVLRARSPRSLLGKSSVLDALGTTTPTAGLTVGDVTVTQVVDYALAKPCMIAESSVDPQCYYAIAYECEVRGSSLGFGALSATARLLWSRTSVPRDAAAQPPDWYRAQVTDVFARWLTPFMRSVLGWVTALESTVTVDALKATQIKVLDGVVAAANEVLARISRLRAMLNLGLPTGAPFGNVSVHVTTFEGLGAAGIVTGIADALGQTSDPDRPPFDKGTELVAGVVLAFGAPTEAALTPFKAVVGPMVGLADSATATVDALVSALEAVGEQLELAEATALAESLTTPLTTTIPVVSLGTDDSACPSAPATVTLGDDLAEDA